MATDSTDGDVDDPYSLRRLSQAKTRARAMGGADKVARQHLAGRLTARERIDLLLDKDSFHELGLLARSDRPQDHATTPTDGKITGYGKIDERAVYVGVDDTTIKAGSYGRVGHKKAHEGMDYAVKKGFPVINLGDAGGGADPGRDGCAWPDEHRIADRSAAARSFCALYSRQSWATVLAARASTQPSRIL